MSLPQRQWEWVDRSAATLGISGAEFIRRCLDTLMASNARAIADKDSVIGQHGRF